ncbi:MAG: hypothetical protein ACE5FV_00930 [Woeseia sp.]
MTSFTDQLRRYSVALISLVVALTSLAYNTWRNEQTEYNRNIRVAGIELLLKLGELERTVFFARYDRDDQLGNPRTGWAYVLTVRDLGDLTREPARSSAANLVRVWNDNWAGLGKSDEAGSRISDSIDRTRSDVLLVLSELD